MKPITFVAVALFGAVVQISSHASSIPPRDFRAPIKDGESVVGMECHWRNKTLEIGLFYPGTSPERRMDMWSTSDMVVFDKKTSLVKETRFLERQCKLGAHDYKVRLTGVPGNSNALGACGAFVTARATVWKNGRKLFDEDLDDCFGDKAYSSVRFTAQSDRPVTALASKKGAKR